MSHKITSVSELAGWLRKWPTGLFAIDGYHGAGKTTLAHELASQLRIPLINLDDFLLPQKGSFLESLRDSELSTALHARPVLVEGVCLLAVAKYLGIKPDVHVYVQGCQPAPRSPRGIGPLAEEVLAYHREFKPAETADILYVRTTNTLEVDPMGNDRFDVDIAFIQAKTKLAITLAMGGMLTLMIGLVVLLQGVTGQDQTLIKTAGFEISASGLGGVIMVTSIVWAFFAYQARPIYSARREVSEKIDPKTGIMERHEHESTTQQLFESKKKSS